MPRSSLSPVDRLVTLPEGWPEDHGYLTLGYGVAQWAMTYLKQPNGPRAGERFRLVNSQLRFWAWWYAVDADGNWLFRRAVRRLAKGAGKSPFAGVQALAEFCGPVRLKDFDPRVPGGCVGRPVDMPWVQVVATAEDQTANTMRMVRAFAPKGSRLAVEYGLDVGKEKLFRAPEGTLEQKASSFASAEGAESSFVVADETEHWTPNKGGPQLHATLLDNLAKSGSRMLETCNAWVPGAESVAEASWDAWVAQEEGRTRGSSGILYDARVAPPTTRLDDADSLRDGLDFVYDDCWWADRRAIIERIWDPAARPDESRRKYLNWPTAAEDAWTTPQQFGQLADPARTVADGEPIALFFDGSKSRDATGLLGCRISDGHVFVLGCYEPSPSHKSGDEVPADEVDGWVASAFEQYDPVGFFGDVKEWESFTKITWPERYADRLVIWAVPGGKEPQPVAWDMRSHSYDFGLAAELTEREIIDRSFTHDGDSRLARHVANARRRPNRWGAVSIGKETADSPHKIDLAVCMIGARMVRRLVLASKEWQRRQRRVTGRGRVVVMR
jgi:hypothetical protein